MSAIAIAESLANVVPDGWDANGRPVGIPWRRKRTPLTLLAAATQEQVMRNTWAPMVEMLDDTLNPPVYDNYPGLEVMKVSGVQLPHKGLIIPVSASATSVKGMRATFTVADQTEVWGKTNRGHTFYNTLVDNATKVGSAIIETPNAFVPGEDSVAERSAQAYFAMLEGRARISDGLLYDHREAPGETDMRDRDSLIEGIRVAYGDSCAHPDGCVLHTPPCAPGWVDPDIILQRVWDPDAEEGWSRGNWLNQIQHPTDAYIAQYEWAAIEAPGEQLRDGDVITLGFDGSRGRAFGKPDATALVACRVSDGFMTAIHVDEAGDDKNAWETWQPNMVTLEAALGMCFSKYRVAAFYADPGKDWRSHVNSWEAKYAAKTLVKRGNHPFEWWMTGGRDTFVEKALLQFGGAVRNGDIRHDGGYALARHVLNARTRIRNGKLSIGKSSKYSSHKIDACIAAVLAWQARADAVSAGALQWGVRRSYSYGRL